MLERVKMTLITPDKAILAHFSVDLANIPEPARIVSALVTALSTLIREDVANDMSSGHLKSAMLTYASTAPSLLMDRIVFMMISLWSAAKKLFRWPVRLRAALVSSSCIRSEIALKRASRDDNAMFSSLHESMLTAVAQPRFSGGRTHGFPISASIGILRKSDTADFIDSFSAHFWCIALA